ncbi:MAG: hypothetical protein E6772_18565, partial [Dysgonomonas sp.]|nr:hypothetical protein [Dysgonomonas sp.]
CNDREYILDSSHHSPFTESIMSLEIVPVALSAEERQSAEIEQDLRRLASADLAGLTGEQTRVAADVRVFVQWLEDERVAFADQVEGEDKFSGLIEIARKYQNCNSFFLSEVGVNASTVWRWASGKSRPSRYVGKRLAEDVKSHVANELWQSSDEAGLFRIQAVKPELVQVPNRV